MIGFLSYIDQLLQMTHQSSSDRNSRRVENGRLIFWLSLFLGLSSYGLVMVGTAIYLMDIYQTSVSLFITGLINLFSMLVIVGVNQLYRHHRRRKFEKVLHNITNDISGITDDISEKLGEGVKDNALILALFSAGLGYFLSRKIFE